MTGQTIHVDGGDFVGMRNKPPSWKSSFQGGFRAALFMENVTYLLKY